MKTCLYYFQSNIKLFTLFDTWISTRICNARQPMFYSNKSSSIIIFCHISCLQSGFVRPDNRSRSRSLYERMGTISSFLHPLYLLLTSHLSFPRLWHNKRGEKAIVLCRKPRVAHRNTACLRLFSEPLARDVVRTVTWSVSRRLFNVMWDSYFLQILKVRRNPVSETIIFLNLFNLLSKSWGRWYF